jgi:1-acyl-sn-glycerol-3-phosphate acyltransferase
LFYWFLKTIGLGPALKLIWRPWVQGAENVPRRGGAILASNHLSFCDSFFLPVVVRRRVTFLAKAEYFTTPGLKGRLSRLFFSAIGQVPTARDDADAARGALAIGVGLLREGKLLGIYPEGTRSPDGRLYRGKTGVARMALEAGVPVIPVAMVNTDKLQPPGRRLPHLRPRPGIRFGRPLDFSAHAAMVGDRVVERSVTDEIMRAMMLLSGQEYVDENASRVKKQTGADIGFGATAAPRGRPSAGSGGEPAPGSSTAPTERTG